MSVDMQTIRITGSWGFENVREMVAEMRDRGFSVDADRTEKGWLITAERPRPLAYTHLINLALDWEPEDDEEPDDDST